MSWSSTASITLPAPALASKWVRQLPARAAEIAGLLCG
jgi:hypothetical protein